MKDFLEKNKIPITIIAAALIIAGSILLSKKPFSAGPPPRPLRQADLRIDFSQAPAHVGKYACVTGKVDHIYTSRKGTIFLNFCRNYRTCPFGAVIFASSASEFPNPDRYTGKTVQITGFITSYQNQPEIVLDNPAQIRIEQ